MELQTYLLVILVGYCKVQAETFPANNIKFTPESGSEYYCDDKHILQYQIVGDARQYIFAQNQSQFYLGVDYPKGSKPWNHIVKLEPTRISIRGKVPDYDNSYDLEKTALENQLSNETASDGIVLYLNEIGHTQFSVHLVQVTADNATSVILPTSYKLTVVRRQRLVDTGFNVAIAVLALLNAFALGCISDLKVVKQESKKLITLAIVFLTQYFILPMGVFALSKGLQVQNEIALGLLFTACVPGGGLGYLIVAITGDAELELSIALNLFQLIIPIGIVPLYVYTLGQLLPNQAGYLVKETYFLGLWNIALLIPYTCGLMMRKKKEIISDAFLNWIMKPLLLLAFILFVTLGLYINMYMFSVLDTMALTSGGAIPFLGFLVGGVLTLICKQGKPAAKTIGIESAITNCIAVIVAIRFTLPQPEADLASAGVLWVFFLTPVPFLLMFIFHKVKKTVMSYFDKKEIKKEQQETILQSFATITQNAFQIGGVHSETKAETTYNAKSNDNGDTCDRVMLLRSLSRHSDPSQVIANNNACLELSSYYDPLATISPNTSLLTTHPQPETT